MTDESASCHSFLVFGGSGPLLILSSYPEASDPHLKAALRAKGIAKFIAYEIESDTVRSRYGDAFDRAVTELGSVEDIRVLDFNGHQIMANFDLSQLGEPVKVGD